MEQYINAMGCSRPCTGNCIVGVGLKGIPEVMTHRKLQNHCFWNFSSSSGDPIKNWSPKKCREGALTSWQGRSWSRRGCLARFRGRRPSPDLLTFRIFCSILSPCRPHYHPSLTPNALPAHPLIYPTQTVTKSILPQTPTFMGAHPSNPRLPPQLQWPSLFSLLMAKALLPVPRWSQNLDLSPCSCCFCLMAAESI